ncbi:hypothetical protein [Paenibacillus chitinolyticus]
MKSFEEAMKDLFMEVFSAYVQRKDEKVLIPSQRVIRGTNVSNSSVYENEMGMLLHSQLTEEYRILVDYPVLFPGKNNRITPDIVILKGNQLQMILELKIDLGYEKDGWEKVREERLKKLKVYKNSTGYKPLNEKTLKKEDKIFIDVPDKIEYANVIFCQKNGSSRITKIIKACKSSTCEDRGDYPFFVLLLDKDLHPNNCTSMEQAKQYVDALETEYCFISDWKPFETYLRNRLRFKNDR